MNINSMCLMKPWGNKVFYWFFYLLCWDLNLGWVLNKQQFELVCWSAFQGATIHSWKWYRWLITIQNHRLFFFWPSDFQFCSFQPQTRAWWKVELFWWPLKFDKCLKEQFNWGHLYLSLHVNLTELRKRLQFYVCSTLKASLQF